MTPNGPIDNSGLAMKRAAAGATCAAVVLAVTLVAGATWSVAFLAAWDAAAIVFLAWVWATVPMLDADETKRKALAEDDSRAVAEALLLGAGTASLVAVAFTLGQAGDAHGTDRGLLITLAIGSVVLAWASVHTVFFLRYARLYYHAPVGGIDFNDDGPPNYFDFAYVALTIGMTWQVSDTTLTAKTIRRVALHHALLSYLFGTVIVAVIINVVAGLLGN